MGNKNSILGNKNYDVGHTKCSRGLQVLHIWSIPLEKVKK